MGTQAPVSYVSIMSSACIDEKKAASWQAAVQASEIPSTWQLEEKVKCGGKAKAEKAA